MVTLLWALVALGAAGTLAYRQSPGWAWSGAGLALAAGAAASGALPGLYWALATWAALAFLLALVPLRRALVSQRLLLGFRKALPSISQTEQEALDSGTVWWEGVLFSGRPDWRQLLAYPGPRLSEEEQAFLDGPVEELCALLDEWRITHERYDLPPEAWQFIKDKGFLGMIIPKEYGGLGFSALAHSQVVMKLASRSGTAAVSVMVPNSLGPAELLLRYGTEEQKAYYLPRLARGLEIPCFALTGPEAGSDAASIPDCGIVCRSEFQGTKDVLGIRLTWEKRYITLGPVATLLGLAFRLYDPDHLLGEREDIGITLALIPTATAGVTIGRRHLPLNAAFQNGPTSGKDVFIPIDWVIGGSARIGQGWRMLMECLAAGRSISLPASATGMAKLAALATGAYARVRVQFKTPIARFEGVEEALARIGAATYAMDAARVMTAGAVDLGERPAIASAIVKYHLTEQGRQVVNDAMDVHGGKGICLGPRNLLGRAYQQIPISITVEGANILTRSLIIFGQGAIRCHPYVLKEIAAIRDPDPERALKAFDAALWGHMGFTLSNAARSLFLGLAGARFLVLPGAPELRGFYRRLARYAAAFALAADVTMLVLGGGLKRRERISARLADILSQLYLASAVLKRYEDEGRNREDLPLARYALEEALYQIQKALDELLQNFPSRVAAQLLRLFVFPLGRREKPPSDALGHAVARILTEPSQARARLTAGIYLPSTPGEPLARLEQALRGAVEAEAVEAKIRSAAKSGKVQEQGLDGGTREALEKGLITEAEAQALERARALTREVIAVDDFPPDFGRESAAGQETLSSDAVMTRRSA